MEPRLSFDGLPSTPINRVVDMQILTHLLQFFTNIIDQDKKKTLIISIEYPHSCHELTCPHCGAQLKRHGIYTRHPGVKEFNLRVLRTIIPNIPDSVTDFKILIPRLYCDNKDCPIVSKNKCKIATFGLVLLKLFIPFKQHLTKLLDVMQDYYKTKEVSETSPKDSEEQIKSKSHLVELNKQYSLLDDEDDKAEDNDFFEEFFEPAHKNMIKNSFAFFIAYFLIPITVLAVFSISVIRFCNSKGNPVIFILLLTFAIAELFYIPRTIVYHNLMVCRGITGVLLNFIHWTLALFALYLCADKSFSTRFRNLAFIFVMFLAITLEGAFVTNSLPNSKSSLAGKAIEASKGWSIGNHNKENIGAKRIVYEKKTQELVGNFKTVFDTLLSNKQTFLDFANVTSMYLLTGRERPAYVGQMPSLLTDLYSQEQFLKEIAEYDCPIAVLGTT